MRFGKKTKGINVTTNYEGEKAWKLSPKMELYTLVCTASLQKKFYTEADEAVDRLKGLILKAPAEFVIKLAIYAREKMYLRSIPLVLAVELCKVCKNSKLIEDLIERVIQRADEIPEILAYFQEANEREGVKKLDKLPHSLMRGVAKAFHKFDQYQFSKYNRDTEVKIRDAMFLCHPKPEDEGREDLFKKIADDTLEVPYTWETVLSAHDGRTRKEKWQELIDSGKVGYMALLKNLRNMLEAEAEKTFADKDKAYSLSIDKVLNTLSDKERVLSSKQLPFRFFSAYREIADLGEFKSSAVMECLEKAIKISTENIKGFDSNTNILIACDMSSSMQDPIAKKSKVRQFEIGLVLGMLLQSRCKSVITGLFGEDWKVVQLPRVNILANTHKLANMIGVVGHSTNGYKAIRWLNENKKVADKVFIFTDSQLWDSDETFSYLGFEKFKKHSTLQDEWNKYKKIAPEAKLYVFDMAGYGTSPIDNTRSDVFQIAGWSEKVFDVLNALEKGEKNLSEIEEIKI